MHLNAIQSGDSLALAVAIVLGAFISEDGATILAATLAATSMLDSRLAFVSAFAGLWVGNLGVYGLARRIGAPILKHRWFARIGGIAEPNSAGTDRIGGHVVLAASRFLPGTRLPAYIGAGLRKMSLAVFAATTALSALAWILPVFAVIHFAPGRGDAAKRGLAALGMFELALFAVSTSWRAWGPRFRAFIDTSIRQRLDRRPRNPQVFSTHSCS